MADPPPPYNPGYTSEKQQMAGGPEVVPGFQPPPQQQYPQAGGQQPYPAPAGQQAYPPPPAAGQAQYPLPGTQQPYPTTGQPIVTGGSHTVIVQQPGVQHVVVGPTRYGPSPITMTCPTCSKYITTTTQSQCCSSFPWLVCGIVCLIGLVTGGITWLGCCLIPFCIPDLYDVDHSCPNCNSRVGHYSRLS